MKVSCTVIIMLVGVGVALASGASVGEEKPAKTPEGVRVAVKDPKEDTTSEPAKTPEGVRVAVKDPKEDTSEPAKTPEGVRVAVKDPKEDTTSEPEKDKPQESSETLPEGKKDETIIKKASEIKKVTKTGATSRQLASQGRSIFTDMWDTVRGWMGLDDYDEEEYEVYDPYSGQYYPASGFAQDSSYASNDLFPVGSSAAGSSYVSYNEHDDLSLNRDDNDEDVEEWGWSDYAMNSLWVLGPMGLLLAAMPAGLVPIVVRRRSLEDDLPNFEDLADMRVMKTLQNLETFDLIERDCQSRVFCELARDGQHKAATIMQKVFYYVTMLTPDAVSKKAGLDALFRSSRNNNCEEFTCRSTSNLLQSNDIVDKNVVASEKKRQ